MTSLLNKFVSRTEYESYEDFSENFKIKVPENFNFAYDVVDEYAKICPEKRALVWCSDKDEDKTITFGEMKEVTDKTANLFTKHGIKKGDAVMLTLKSRYDFWLCMVALHKIGAIPIPGTHMLKSKDIIYRVGKADVKMIVSIDCEDVPEQVDAAHKELGNIKLVKMFAGDMNAKRDGWINLRKEISESSKNWKRPTGDAATKNCDVLLAYFSSGTTGHPKLVKHDELYPFGHMVTARYWQNVEDDGLHYTVSDTGWAKCAWGKIYGQWIAGTAIFVYDYDRFDAKNMMDKVAKHKVTTFCAPPTIYRFMIKEDMSKYDFSNMHYAATAGEPLNPTVYNKFLENTKIRLMEGYGQTETAVIIANFPWMKPKPGSMGKPSPVYEVAILDKEGKECDIGEEGEISIKTGKTKPFSLFLEYHGDDEKTKDSCYDGHYHTGDTAWKDEDGYYWFVGRTDDLIKSSGYRIGPFEVESALLSHPAVVECAITGVPDPTRGQIVKATCVLTKNYKPSEELKKELQEHVKNVTAPYKYPRIIEFVETLPKTISGKIRRVEIRAKDSGTKEDER